MYNKDKPLVKTAWMDLSTSIGQAEFWKLYMKEKPGFVFLAPPCDTASRARDIRLFSRKCPTTLRGNNGDGKACHDPPSLRSDTHPDGLPGLSPENKIRVVQANALYGFSAQVIKRCFKDGVAWALEHPRNGYLWLTTYWKEVLVDTHESSNKVVIGAVPLNSKLVIRGILVPRKCPTK